MYIEEDLPKVGTTVNEDGLEISFRTHDGYWMITVRNEKGERISMYDSEGYRSCSDYNDNGERIYYMNSQIIGDLR